MAKYTIEAPDGKRITFEWNDPSPPTDADMEEVFAQAGGATVPPPAEAEITPEWAGKHPNLYGAVMAARNTLGPIVEAGAAAGGGVLGAGAGIPTGPGAVASGVAGAGLGYAASRRLLDAIDEAMGTKKAATSSETEITPEWAGKHPNLYGAVMAARNTPATLASAAIETGKDVALGATMEALGGVMGGAPIKQTQAAIAKFGTKGIETLNKSIAGKGIIGKSVELIGKAGKELLGATTGAGPGMAEGALKGGKSFRDAMRGKVTGDEIVDNAASALQSLKERRAAAYQQKLIEVAKNKQPIDMATVKNELSTLMGKYNVKVLSDGTIDTSRIAMGKTGRNDIKDIIETVSQWGTKEGDNTPLGLDVLKRQLDDFYSDSSQARQFVTALRNKVKDSIVKQVPQYAEMTKGYAEATTLIKDIESNLMLRKSGMSGRITADQTLRRLTSSMRENFEMRKDLVNILGEKGGVDLSGQIAGYSASQIMPRGLVGKLSGGSVGYLVYLNPKLWPVLAASSPRIAGEFLNVYGKGLVHAKKISPATYRTIAFETTRAFRSMNDDQKEQYVKDLYQRVREDEQ